MNIPLTSLYTKYGTFKERMDAMFKGKDKARCNLINLFDARGTQSGTGIDKNVKKMA